MSCKKPLGAPGRLSMALQVPSQGPPAIPHALETMLRERVDHDRAGVLPAQRQAATASATLRGAGLFHVRVGRARRAGDGLRLGIGSGSRERWRLAERHAILEGATREPVASNGPRVRGRRPSRKRGAHLQIALEVPFRRGKVIRRLRLDILAGGPFSGAGRTADCRRCALALAHTSAGGRMMPTTGANSRERRTRELRRAGARSRPVKVSSGWLAPPVPRPPLHPAHARRCQRRTGNQVALTPRRWHAV